MKIGIVGAGIYGCTIALELTRAGFDVDLIEKEKDVMNIGTPISLRAHTGYFYARSTQTMLECRRNVQVFRKIYPKAFIDDGTHYYIIAKHGSKIAGQEFLENLDRHGLPYKKLKEPLLDERMIDACVGVEEYSYDPEVLKKEVKKRLAGSRVKLLLNTDAAHSSFAGYDLKVITGYASNNDIARTITGQHIQEYEYRFCEKVVVTLPETFRKKNFVVLDGPFFQIDPFGRRDGLFALSHFKHSIHMRHEGSFFDIDEERRNYLGKGLVRNPFITNAPGIIQSISEFIPEIKKAKIVGSLYAIKPVIPKESSDARPVIIKPLRKDVLSVLSGKGVRMHSGSRTVPRICARYGLIAKTL